MEGFWPIMFMLVALKIPAIGMIWLLYWAATNEQNDGLVDESEGGGGKRRPRPRLPRGPRRGPHGGGAVNPVPPRSRRPVPAVASRSRDGSRQPEPGRARHAEPGRTNRS